ncbi:MAG: rhomboid family intramembrane serine protease [Dinoroseobacter sp.]|nr:rhomboid family intramembrane serine protease [Dinoroseobacter sp.]MDJ0995394.1 rhomboid family intramembrane serine protease [Dinoroseobacter sp.]
MNSNPESPFNPLPPSVIALSAVILGIEVLFSLGARGIIGGPEAVGWRLAALEDWSFIPPVFDWMLANGQFPPEQMARFLTYPLIHANFTHAVFVAIFVLAIGKMVSEVFGGLAFLSVFWGSSIVGALVYWLALQTDFPLVGGYPGVYGLIGAYTFLLWVSLVHTGGPQYRAFGLIGVLLAIQLFFAVFFETGQDWVADIAGFAAGFLMSFVVSPGGWARLMERLRQR